MTLLYSVFEESDIIMRASRVHNGGNGRIDLKRIMSVNMDYMNGSGMDLISLPGRYGQERQIERQPLTHHVHKVRGARGRDPARTAQRRQRPLVAAAWKKARKFLPKQ